jgi:hypothetical protein
LPTGVPAAPEDKAQLRQRLDAEMDKFRAELRQEFGVMPAVPDVPNIKVQPPVPPEPPQAAMSRWRGWFSEGHFIPMFGAPWRWIPGLLQVLGLAALLWLLFRAVRPRGPRPVRTRDTGPLAGGGE